jgi:hypothetical protein
MAASASSLTTISALLKQKYLSSSLIQNSMIDFGPLLAKMVTEGDTSFNGANCPVPLIYSGGGGFSSSMAAAFNTATPAASVNFLLTRAVSFGQIVLGGEALAASENPDGAFISDLALETETKRRRIKEYLAALVYGAGTGVVAQVAAFSTASSGATQGVITLKDAPTAARFQVNDVINVTIGAAYAATSSLTQWATSGALTTATASGAPDGGTGTAGAVAQVAYVIAVNIPAGTIQVSATQGGSAATLVTTGTAETGGAHVFAGSTAGLDVGSFIGFNGDLSLAAQPPVLQAAPANSGGSGSAIASGILAWLPVGGPQDTGSTSAKTGSFFGVNRNGNSPMYGQVIDATSAGLNLGTIRAALTNAVAQLRQVSSRPKRCYLHPIAFFKLSLELQSQGMYPGNRGEGPSGEGSFGFSSMVLPTDAGDITVIADPQCVPVLNDLCATASTYDATSGYSGAMTAFILDDNWELLSLGDVPKLDETDGNFFLRIQGTDNYQIQMKAYWNLATHRPNGSCAVLLPL